MKADVITETSTPLASDVMREVDKLVTICDQDWRKEDVENTKRERSVVRFEWKDLSGMSRSLNTVTTPAPYTLRRTFLQIVLPALPKIIIERIDGRM